MATKTHLGFSLIELLIVVATLAILILAVLTGLSRQRDKADDAKMKSDLARLKIAFEDYYNDHNCYPPAEWFDNADDCGSNQLSPYLSAIPCNRKTGLPYVLETDSTTCKWFKFYTFLINSDDPQAVALRGDETSSTRGNYGISSDNTVVTIYYSPTASSTPTPTPTATPPAIPNSAWCSAVNNCSSFDPNLWSCTPSYPANTNCGNSGCPTVGTCNPL